MQVTLFDAPPPEEPVSRIVVQHNALVNARFDLSTVEMRLFMAMLSRIGRNDSEFREMRIPLTEIVALSGRRPSGKDYQQVAGMCDQLVSRILHIERPDLTRKSPRRSASPDFDKIPLMAYAKYRGEEGALYVRFNDEVMPYLLQLQRNFTKAQVVQLLKLKSPHSYRIYWLLKEYAAFGSRAMEVKELKRLLNLEGQYKQFPLFRLRVLDRARQELGETDLPFTYELVREGKSVSVIRFNFPPVAGPPDPALAEAAPESADWEAALLQAGLAVSSRASIAELVAQRQVTSEYVRFVVRTQRDRHRLGKVKSLAGSIFSAVTKGHLLSEFEEVTRRVPATRPVAVQAAAPEAVRYRLQEVEAMYQTMVAKKLHKGFSFDEHLQQVYLSQGFALVEDAERGKWLVKPQS